MIQPRQATLTEIVETSRTAYREHAMSGELGRQQREIYRALCERPGLTRNEISLFTGIRLTSVCGRVRELLDIAAIEVTNRRPCSVTGSLNEVLEVAGR